MRNMKQQRPIIISMRYYEKCFIFFYFILFNVLTMQAQNRTLSGIVTDIQGEPIIGVNVTVLGGNQGTITDLEGQFSISIPQNAVMKFSFVGYKTKQINVAKGTNVLNVTMEEDAIMLEQTVVVAMNLRRDEKSLSTAYQKVDTKSMSETRDANFLNMLTGKVAGLQVMSNGAAGSASVVIRGMNSITGNNQPLYVIDGVPIINDVDTSESNIDYGNPAASLNPDDIESMTVLKGANASALYGSDAANGAIIITTKQASAKKGLAITFSTNLQFSDLSQYPIYQNVYGSGESVGLKKEGFNYMGNNTYAFNPALPYGTYRVYGNQRSWGMPMNGGTIIGRDGNWKTYSPANSLLDLYEIGHTWTNTISIEKATDMASVRFSYSNINSDDVMMKQNELNRNTMNLRANIKPIKKVSIDFGARYTNEKVDNRNSRNSSKTNPLYSAAWMPRDLTIGELSPWKNEDGTFAGYNGGGFVNPLWCLNEISNSDEKNWLLVDLTVNYEIIKGLKLRLKGAVDYSATRGWNFVNMYGPNEASNGDGEYKEFSENYKNITYEAMLSYDKRWNNFNLAAALGANSQDYTRKKMNSFIGTLMVPDLKSLTNNGGETIESWQDYNAKKKQAVYGTLSLGYRDFAYIDFTGRNDWTSTLPTNNRSYFYSSVGVSLILTEAFKKIPSNILSFAKIRASYANVGNDAGFDQLYDALEYGGVFKGNTWFQSGTKKLNSDLKPESTISYEVGADLKFWNNRIGLDFTYYTKTTKDQIINAGLTDVSGYKEGVFNAGKIRNWGTELSLTIVPIKWKKFQWESTLNWSKNNSEVLELIYGVDRINLNNAQSEGTVTFYIEKGHSLGTLYAKMAKIDENGNIICNNEGKPKEEADQFLCDVSPKWLGGWRNTFHLGNFSASVLLDFRKGGKVWSATAHQGTRDGQTMQSLEGREASIFSQLILGENGEERRGFLQTNWTVNPNATQNAGATSGVFVPYGDNRPKGIQVPNGVLDTDAGMRAGMTLTEANCWVLANNYWMNTGANARYFLYDTSFLKLREISISYDVPRNFLHNKLGNVFQSMKIAFVGRNLAILHQNTPKGIDPEAASSLGVIQGMEKGFSLPTATYGFDFKVTF